MAAKQSEATAQQTQWFAIFSMFLGVMGLIGGEFLPISLLTPMAADLGISEGMAGQSVTMVGIFAVLASLLLAPSFRRADRRILLLSLSALLIVSHLAVALAPNFPIMLIGRACLGLCVGGFWSLAAAVVMRLAAKAQRPKALSFVFGGVSAATILAMPFAAYMNQFVSWRGVFAAAALFSLLSFLCQCKALPPLPANAAKPDNFRAQGQLLKTPWVALGLTAIMASFAGYYVLFTYLRPFYEQSLHFSGGGLSLALLAFSLANCGGTFAAGFALGRFFRQTLYLCLTVLIIVPAALAFSFGRPQPDVALTMIWAFSFGLSNVGWSAWIIRTMPDKSELAGGLMVASIQLSIMLGAALGGAIFDRRGIAALFPAGFALSVAAIIALWLSFCLFRRRFGRPV